MHKQFAVGDSTHLLSIRKISRRDGKLGRLGERGSKRALYEVSENYEGMLTAQNRLMETMAELLRTGAASVASGSACKRLEEMAEFYLATREAMDAALRRWRQRPRS